MLCPAFPHLATLYSPGICSFQSLRGVEKEPAKGSRKTSVLTALKGLDELGLLPCVPVCSFAACLLKIF